MQSSNAPNKISLPFAASGTKNTIPVPSQQGVTPGAASFTDGFPPLTFTPLSAGGVPPSGADFNGVLNAITALQQWKSAGGQFPFDATFAAEIGGYPKGATVLKADGTGLWISTAENNTSNPDTGGSGWLAFSVSAVQSGSYNSASDTGTVNAYAATLNPAPAAITPGMMVHLTGIGATNTGPSTLNLNGSGARPIFGLGNLQLQGGELTSGNEAILMAVSGSAWMLLGCRGAGLQVAPGSHTNHAVNYGQLVSLNATSGYQYHPNGIIIQWQYLSMTSGSDYNPAFPLAFPNACASVVGSPGYTPNSGTIGTIASAPDVSNPKTRFVARSSINVGAYFLSIGY